MNKFFSIYKMALAILLLIAANTVLNAQPSLTKAEMYEDFNALVKIIKDTDSRLAIRQQVTGKDILTEIENLSSTIDTITTLESYYKLVQMALYLTQDIHNHIMYYEPEFELVKNYVDDSIIQQSNFLAQQGWYSWSIHLMGLYYVNGDYYFVQDLTTKQGEEEVIFIQKGTKVLKINGVDIDRYVLETGGKLRSTLRWDNVRKKYYTKHNVRTEVGKPFVITAILPTGEKVDIIRDLTTRLRYRGTMNTDYEEKKVLYFSDNKILYVRVLEMDMEDLPFYQEEILKYKNKPIEKVVIDIRKNSGGNDKVWRELLSSIIDKPMEFNTKLLFKNTPLTISYLRDVRDEAIEVIQPNDVIIGRDTLFCAYNETDTILPAQNTIAYSGTIYVLGDEQTFSSAGALLSVCKKADRLVSVGQSTGFMLGRGINPFIFSLPKSKIIFRYVTFIEGIDTQNINDYFHDTLEIPVEKSLEEVLFEENWEQELYSKDYLFNYDSTFKKVLEL